MKIGEAAAASGCHLETIRYYERVGLMPAPARTASGYREYSATDVRRLKFISRGRELGFSLDDIRSLLRLGDEPDMDCEEVDRLARAHRNDITSRIAQLQDMVDQLDRVMRSCLGGKRGNCEILRTLEIGTTTTRAARLQPALGP